MVGCPCFRRAGKAVSPVLTRAQEVALCAWAGSALLSARLSEIRAHVAAECGLNTPPILAASILLARLGLSTAKPKPLHACISGKTGRFHSQFLRNALMRECQQSEAVVYFADARCIRGIPDQAVRWLVNGVGSKSSGSQHGRRGRVKIHGAVNLRNLRCTLCRAHNR